MPKSPPNLPSRPPADPIKPVQPASQPKRAAAIARGGHEPVDNPEAGKQPLAERYGKSKKGPPPVNPARERS